MSEHEAKLHVALAVTFRQGLVLVAKRLAGAHLGGMWEFPGGKLAPGETPETCAVRELQEETGVMARAVRRRSCIEWQYPERHVVLHPVDCEWLAGEATARDVALVRWVTLDELAALEMPAANRALVEDLVRAENAAAAARSLGEN